MCFHSSSAPLTQRRRRSEVVQPPLCQKVVFWSGFHPQSSSCCWLDVSFLFFSPFWVKKKNNNSGDVWSAVSEEPVWHLQSRYASFVLFCSTRSHTFLDEAKLHLLSRMKVVMLLVRPKGNQRCFTSPHLSLAVFLSLSLRMSEETVSPSARRSRGPAPASTGLNSLQLGFVLVSPSLDRTPTFPLGYWTSYTCGLGGFETLHHFNSAGLDPCSSSVHPAVPCDRAFEASPLFLCTLD